MQEGKLAIEKYTAHWQFLLVMEGLLYGLGFGVLCWFIFKNLLIAIVTFIIISAIAVLIIKPWKISLLSVTAYLDKYLNTAEYSSGLLVNPPAGLSGLARLQQEKVNARIASDIGQVRPKTGTRKALMIALALIIIGFISSQLLSNYIQPAGSETSNEERITLQATDSIEPNYNAPILKSQKLSIQYPTYTNLKPRTSGEMNVKAVEGSRLYWELTFEGPIKEVRLEGFNTLETFDLKVLEMSSFIASGTIKPDDSGYYNFKFTDSLGTNYTSDIYAIEITQDQSPEVEIKDIPQFTSFDYNDLKELAFTTEINDDYGIASAEIIATVSKGSGESVKFREEKLSFDQNVTAGSKSLRLTKKIRLDQLQMDLGDELYFYVETRDQKTPRPNVSRSETFFAVLRDTVSDRFAVEGTMGADLMPDYFRSQRQLIIDTEKLIKERSQLLEREFTNRSNNLGFDQKALRLKYGQFMGDEADSGIAVTPDISTEDFDPEDPTVGFRHDHDSENEHNLVEEDHDHKHEEDHESEDEQSPLENYVHNHDDPEESTLFTESLRGKLKNAMAQMWDAELYLRLSKPDQSLPYQYEALKLIQEIKNSARIYVHRIGFDPPPIKEDKRLTGDIKEVTSVFKQENLENEEPFSAMRESVAILEDRLAYGGKIEMEDEDAFAKAGEELALLAIKEPSKHLKTLQQLKWLTEEKTQPMEVLRSVQKGLLDALPNVPENPVSNKNYRGDLEKLFMNELSTGGR